MSKFRKAAPQQAKLKMAFYGSQGTGKTLTSLLIAEGLAKRDGKRIAFVDSERGTDMYACAIKERAVHPDAFDFDALYTRSLMETLEEVKALDPNVYGVVIIDSITHLWDAAKESYTGKRGPAGQIPIQAWGAIKRPYKQLIANLLDANLHVLICGREAISLEANEFGDLEVTGTKIKAESETGYEPHLLVRMRQIRNEDKTWHVEMFVEKDRSGVLAGKTIINPDYTTVAPIVQYLTAGEQAHMGSLEEASEKDAEAIGRIAEEEERERTALFEQIRVAIESANDLESLKSAWSLTGGKKKRLGEELFSKLEVIKDARKAAVMKAA